MLQLSPINQRRYSAFFANKRAKYSLVLLTCLFFLTLFAELIANDKPLLVSFKGELCTCPDQLPRNHL